jgi:hypothetical protein
VRAAPNPALAKAVPRIGPGITARRRTAVEARMTVTLATIAARKVTGQEIVGRRERSRPTSLARTIRSLC